MDDCLAAGFLFTEGIISSIDDISAMEGIDCDGVSQEKLDSIFIASVKDREPYWKKEDEDEIKNQIFRISSLEPCSGNL